MQAALNPAAVSARLRRRAMGWLLRRRGPEREVTLDQRRLFIFPAPAGFFLLLILLVMLVTAINYENNSAFALTFLLATVFVVAVLHTHANLSGLTVTALRAEPVFAGQQAEYRIALRAGPRRAHIDVTLSWGRPGEGLHGTEARVSVPPGGACEVLLYLPTRTRGWRPPDRLHVESRYPLGLLRCWSWLRLDLPVLVYPLPEPGPELLTGASGDQPAGYGRGRGEDEFEGLRAYRPGDRLRQVHWKSVAKEQEPQSKVYGGVIGAGRWLDFSLYEGVDPERRLRWLTEACLRLHDRDERYGLRLPGQQIDIDRGALQRERVLRALALHDRPAAP